jgi:hypothetical protein
LVLGHMGSWIYKFFSTGTGLNTGVNYVGLRMCDVKSPAVRLALRSCAAIKLLASEHVVVCYISHIANTAPVY